MINKQGTIEAILFICGKEGCPSSNLRRYLNLEAEQLQDLISEINKRYKEDPNSPFIIHIYDNNYYMLTKPELKNVLDQLNVVKVSRSPISKTLLEVLAIIAYNPDCTSGKIAEVRDTDSSGSIDRLIKLGLVSNDGRADTPGRPYKFNVTKKFYDLIGVRSFGALPKLDSSFEIDDETDFFDSNRGNGKEEVKQAKALLISEDGMVGTEELLKETSQSTTADKSSDTVQEEGNGKIFDDVVEDDKQNDKIAPTNNLSSDIDDPFGDSLDDAINELIDEETKDEDDSNDKLD
ncbi:MAG: SMC-Scp complex subunit ScpB [Mycoplasmataceae bacterium]|jgi:segregation and condensation protein B|nr:SMC-Scp complex subunit ScpB [Mycoplasmataceae bacterium]